MNGKPEIDKKYLSKEDDLKDLDVAIGIFQDLGVRVGMRSIMAIIDAGATIDQVRAVCEHYLKVGEK